jgi:hypothetical protein
MPIKRILGEEVNRQNYLFPHRPNDQFLMIKTIILKSEG